MYQTLMEVDREKRLGNQERLRQLKREQGGRVTVMCSHDALEFEALSAESPYDGRLPAGVPLEK